LCGKNWVGRVAVIRTAFIYAGLSFGRFVEHTDFWWTFMYIMSIEAYKTRNDTCCNTFMPTIDMVQRLTSARQSKFWVVAHPSCRHRDFPLENSKDPNPRNFPLYRENYQEFNWNPKLVAFFPYDLLTATFLCGNYAAHAAWIVIISSDHNCVLISSFQSVNICMIDATFLTGPIPTNCEGGCKYAVVTQMVW
jgi:hypothetical protein